MSEVSLKPGMFTWTDLSAPDPAKLKPFYTELFGWEATDLPAGEMGTYTMFAVDGKDVAGLGSQPPGQQEQGMPPMWSSYVLVDDVDATSQRAGELGGQVMMPPMDVMDSGRMSVVQDPTGGVVCLWEARSHQGAALFNQQGAMTWNELATRDAGAAADFYRDLLGWGYDTMEMHGTTYRVIQNADRPNGGILQMNDEWLAEIPAHWMVYFAVDDVDEAARKVEALGGKISVPPTDTVVGRMSVVGDPQGGTFTLFKGAPG